MTASASSICNCVRHGHVGLNIVAVKYLTQYMDARILAAVRIVIALLVVTLIIKVRGGRIPKLTRAQLGWLALAGFLVVYAHQAALVAGWA